MSSTRVSGQDKKLPILKVEDLGLRCNLRVLGGFNRGIVVKRKRHDKLSGVPRCRRVGDVVLDETGVALGLLVRAAFLVQCCLHENIKGIAVSSNCQSLETVVVVTAGRIISWVNIISGTLIFVICGRIRRERLGSISHRNHGIGRSNSCDHYTRSIESVRSISSEPSIQIRTAYL
jgi:hypothetical protein